MCLQGLSRDPCLQKGGPLRDPVMLILVLVLACPVLVNITGSTQIFWVTYLYPHPLIQNNQIWYGDNVGERHILGVQPRYCALHNYVARFVSDSQVCCLSALYLFIM